MTDDENTRQDSSASPDADDPAPQVGDLSKQLRVLGLDEREAKAYLCLLQLGSAEIRSLTPAFEASRSTLYRTLDHLCERGFAIKTLDSPKEYAAVEPHQVFEGKLDELRSRKEEVQAVRSELVDRLHDLQESSGAAATEGRHWNRLSGVHTVFETFARVVDLAETSIRVASVSTGTWHLAEPVVEMFWRRLRQRSKTVETDCLFGADDRRRGDLARGHQPKGLHVRQVDRDVPFLFVIVDGTEVVVCVQGATREPTVGDSHVALHTDTPGIVEPLKLLFELLWEESDPVPTAAGQDEPT